MSGDQLSLLCWLGGIVCLMLVLLVGPTLRQVRLERREARRARCEALLTEVALTLLTQRAMTALLEEAGQFLGDQTRQPPP